MCVLTRALTMLYHAYIGISFNNTEAFSLLQLTVLTHKGLQEPYEVCHLLECPFNSLRVSYSKQWKYSLQALRSSISQPLFTVFISTRMRKKFTTIHWKHWHTTFSESSDVKLQILWLLKGVCVGYVSSLISQKKKLTWNFQLQKLIVGYKCNLL